MLHILLGPCVHVVDAQPLFYRYFLYFFICTIGVNSFGLLCFNYLCDIFCSPLVYIVSFNLLMIGSSGLGRTISDQAGC